jgi:hypothetical protein
MRFLLSRQALWTAAPLRRFRLSADILLIDYLKLSAIFGPKNLKRYRSTALQSASRKIYPGFTPGSLHKTFPYLAIVAVGYSILFNYGAVASVIALIGAG